MRRALLSLIFVSWVVIGCSTEEPEPEAPPPPPPPTPQEISAKIIADAQLNDPLPPAGAKVRPEMAQAATGFFTRTKSANSATQEGKQALQIVSRKVDERIKAMENAELWEHVLLYSDVHAILNPGSKRFKRTRDKAIVELKRPKVTLKGFVQEGNSNQTIVFADIYLPLNGVTYNERVRVGDEFYGLKLIEIIGDNQGVRFEYLENGEEFEVLTQAARQ